MKCDEHDDDFLDVDEREFDLLWLDFFDIGNEMDNDDDKSSMYDNEPIYDKYDELGSADLEKDDEVIDDLEPNYSYDYIACHKYADSKEDVATKVVNDAKKEDGSTPVTEDSKLDIETTFNGMIQFGFFPDIIDKEEYEFFHKKCIMNIALGIPLCLYRTLPILIIEIILGLLTSHFITHLSWLLLGAIVGIPWVLDELREIKSSIVALNKIKKIYNQTHI